jgi:N-methylhydantoinase A
VSSADLRLAVDVGGTFTDLVLSGDGVGERIYKVSSTPRDPSDGVLAGLGVIAEDLGLDNARLAEQIGVIVHGTTITTNALLTRTGAVTGLITTEGFRDILLLRQGRRERQWDSKTPPAPHLVPRERILTVEGRVNRDGAIVTPLSEQQVREAARTFREQGVEAIGVSLVFSFLNNEHERRVAEILGEELPGTFVSLSYDIAPQIRLYERTSTTVVNAHVGPILHRYLDRLRSRLADLGFDGSLQIMQSNGGLASATVVADQAVTTLLSGPAGGPIASARTAAPMDLPKTMTIDMGGTSFEASLARGGETEVRPFGELAGYQIATAMLDISTIGAGGGSIAWINQGGMLRVGPQSAGAEPGPACYGRGGTVATVTDANVLLGYLGDSFVGGELKLDRRAAERAVGAIADELEIGLIDAAAGIKATIDASMTDSLRLLTVNRGLDPRQFALVAAGGAGPVHAASLAEDLGIDLVVAPRDASVLCASGILVTDFKHSLVRTVFGRRHAPDAIEELFWTLESEAQSQLDLEGVSPDSVRFKRVAEVRYQGQLHAIEIGFPEGAVSESVLAELEEDFHPAHEERYGHALRGTEIEILNIRLEASGRAWESPEPAGVDPGPETTPSGSRPAWFDGDFVETPLYDALALPSGVAIEGPALLELPSSTIVVPPRNTVAVHPSGTYLLYPSNEPLQTVVERLRSGGTSV